MEQELQLEIIDPAQHLIAAVNLPQLMDKANWMCARLTGYFPGQQDVQILNWLRTISGASGSYHFVCTKHAVALSEARSEQLTVHPVIIDHFVIVQEGADISEGQALYMDMKRWAVNMGSTEIRINPKSDVSRDLIEMVIGKLVKRESLIAKLGK